MMKREVLTIKADLGFMVTGTVSTILRKLIDYSTSKEKQSKNFNSSLTSFAECV